MLHEKLAKARYSSSAIPISVHKERFREWQNDDITQMFLRDMAQMFIEHLDDELPTEPLLAGGLALIRQGEQLTVEAMLDWEPEYLATEDDDD